MLIRISVIFLQKKLHLRMLKMNYLTNKLVTAIIIVLKFASRRAIFLPDFQEIG